MSVVLGYVIRIFIRKPCKKGKHALAFNLLYLLKKATSQLDSGVVTHPLRSRQHPAKSLNDLDFADDITLLESSISRAQAQLTKTAEAAADLALSSAHKRQSI